MLNVIWVKFKDYRQSIPMILVMTTLAILLIYVFGQSFSGAGVPRVAIADLDASETSREFADRLEEMKGFNYTVVNYEQGFQDTKDGRYIAFVVLEEGFGHDIMSGDGKITMYKSGESVEHYTLQSNIEGLVRLFTADEKFLTRTTVLFGELGIETDRESLRTIVEEQVEKYPVMKVKVASYQGAEAKGYDSLKHSFIGFILFFSMFKMVFGIGYIVDEKENRVWQRQVVSPVSMAKILSGNMIASVVVGMIQLLLMVIVSSLLFRIDWGGSMIALLLVLLAFVIAVTCMGLFLAGLVSTMQQLGSFSPIVIVSTSMIGGCMWPLEIISSKVLLFMADLTPQRWAYKALKTVIVNGGGLTEVIDSIVILLIIALVFFVLATVKPKVVRFSQSD